MGKPDVTNPRFVFISSDEMLTFLHGLSPRFTEVDWPGQETVFALPLRHHPDVFLLVFTSIVGDRSRDSGKDALRVTLFDKRTERFLGHQSHTKRLVGWQDRLTVKIKELGEKITQYVCPMGCGGYLTKQKGPVSDFFGCTNYPTCRCTRPLR